MSVRLGEQALALDRSYIPIIGLDKDIGRNYGSRKYCCLGSSLIHSEQ